jgi:Mrp family chromosome partitioning ATPase
MDPIDYRRALARAWPLPIVLGVVGLLVGLLLSMGMTATPVLTQWKTASLVGSPPAATGFTDAGPINSGVTTDQIVYFARHIKVEVLAAEFAGHGISPAEVQARVSVAGPVALPSGGISGQPGIVAVTVMGTTPSLSAALNNAFDQALAIGLVAQVQGQQQSQLEQVQKSIADVEGQLVAQGSTSTPATAGLLNQLGNLFTRQGQLTSIVPDSGFHILQPAQTSQATRVVVSPPTGVTRPQRGLLGLGIGLLIGLGIALSMELLDTHIRSRRQVEEYFGYRVLVEVAGSSSGSVTSYQMLRMSTLLEGWAPGLVGPRQVILVVSASNEPSRPHVAANLAIAFAEAGQHVVVVTTLDLDEDGSDQTIPPTTGAVSAADVRVHMEPSKIDGVSRLSLKPFVGSGARLVTRAPAVFGALRQVADVVIVEAPPFLSVYHGEVLTKVSDVVMVVGEFGYTRFADARRTGRLLRRLGAPVLGVVVTDDRPFRGKPVPEQPHDRVDGSSSSSIEPGLAADTPPGASARIEV